MECVRLFNNILLAIHYIQYNTHCDEERVNQTVVQSLSIYYENNNNIRRSLWMTESEIIFGNLIYFL